MKILLGFILLFITTSQIGCTQSGGSGNSILESLIGSEPSDLGAAQSEISQIQKSLNQDINMQLTKEDEALLISSGIIDSNTELKGWVK